VRADGGRPDSVLVVEPPDPERVVTTAAEALTVPPPTGRVLGLLTETPVEAWLATWSDAGYPTEATDVVTLERRLRTDGGVPGGRMPLVKLSLELSDRFDWLSATGSGVVSVDHVAPLVALTDRERAFRFVHVVASHARANGHRFVAHVDPERVDDITRQVFTQAFDRVVDRRMESV
jgi:hypothetical protein